jgi:hypothetical protein
MIEQLGNAANCFAPSDSDWVVTLVFKDGRTVNRRINPGTVTEEHAVGFAIASEQARYADIDQWSIRRAGDRKIVLEDGFAEFLKRRMR